MDLLVLDYDFCDISLIKEVLKFKFELYLYNVHFAKQINDFPENCIKAIIVDNPNNFH